MKNKQKTPSSNDLKAEIVRRYGTIAVFAEAIKAKPATVYSALKYRRNGRVAKAIRAGVLS